MSTPHPVSEFVKGLSPPFLTLSLAPHCAPVQSLPFEVYSLIFFPFFTIEEKNVLYLWGIDVNETFHFLKVLLSDKKMAQK